MTFDVELAMFQHGVIRSVNVPNSELNGQTEHDLGRIFYHGQNDVHAQKNRVSVSAGDVIRYHGQRFLIMGLGFEKLGPDEKVPTDQMDLLRRIFSQKKNNEAQKTQNNQNNQQSKNNE